MFEDASPTYIPATNCSDFFADQVDESTRAFFDYSLDDAKGYWLCPDTSQLSLLNDQATVAAMILPCATATELVDYSPAYGDQTCETYEAT